MCCHPFHTKASKSRPRDDQREAGRSGTDANAAKSCSPAMKRAPSVQQNERGIPRHRPGDNMCERVPDGCSSKGFRLAPLAEKDLCRGHANAGRALI
ncbi:hypothetical protein FGB62_417g00, partial [Gracilaria domingensis]